MNTVSKLYWFTSQIMFFFWHVSYDKNSNNNSIPPSVFARFLVISCSLAHKMVKQTVPKPELCIETLHYHVTDPRAVGNYWKVFMVAFRSLVLFPHMLLLATVGYC